ncbi:MAG: hypothetical protein ABIR58_09900 [Gemmatimonadaceae bacterium]
MKFLLLSEAFAVATFGLGWWSVPVVAALWGIFGTPASRQALFAALCATFGWASLLALHAARGSIGAVAAQISEVMRLPSGVLYALTLLFPALLAWSAAALASGLRDRRVAQ